MVSSSQSILNLLIFKIFFQNLSNAKGINVASINDPELL